MPKKYVWDFKVITNNKINLEYFTLKLEAPEELPEIFPGQFVEVLVTNSQNTFLRRPLSIHDVDYESNTILLLIQIVGEGTHQLQYSKPGDLINMIFPLGKSYSLPEGNNALLVGGGCGIAPLLYLARFLKKENIMITTLMGGRSKDHLIEIDAYKQFGKVLLATDDGSEGEKGFVTEHSVLKDSISGYNRIYTCGPEPMMRALAKIAKEKRIDLEVSLENLMACGIGACLCCVVETVEGNKCTCTEGPVFNINELTW